MENVQRLLDSLWAILKEYQKATRKCPKGTDTLWANVPVGWV
jgi:hypothetical protein